MAPAARFTRLMRPRSSVAMTALGTDSKTLRIMLRASATFSNSRAFSSAAAACDAKAAVKSRSVSEKMSVATRLSAYTTPSTRPSTRIGTQMMERSEWSAMLSWSLKRGSADALVVTMA